MGLLLGVGVTFGHRRLQLGLWWPLKIKALAQGMAGARTELGGV